MRASFSNLTSQNKLRWLLLPAIIFFILLALASAGLLAFNEIYQDKIYPNIFAGDLSLGGLTTEQAKELLNQQVDKINQNGITFSHKNNQAVIMPVLSSSDADLAIQIINFNVDKAAAEAISYGREKNFFLNLKNKFLLIAKKQLYLKVSVNQEQIIKILNDGLAKDLAAAQNASLIVKQSPGGSYAFTVLPEKLGKALDYEDAISRMLNNLSNLNGQALKLSTVTQYPKILAKDCLNINSKAEEILSSAPLTLAYASSSWPIGKNQLAEMLALKPNNSAADKVRVGLDPEKLKTYLSEQIAPKINIKPQEAKFAIADGKVREFQNGQDGLELDLAATAAKIENAIMPNVKIELTVKVQPALLNAGNINDFGIKEIIGVGTSNFAGSPANRRHNIKVGAAAVNGTLIKPGEEFSLLKTLGEISAATGYLPELVIKENKTTPEFGGGLCQIGTTVFRSTIESGLPVTQRRNHSYRVAYYEPAGTDATIYDPWPDFRFLNDTPAYILIQAKFSGDNLSFEFWGTRDGRIAEAAKPTIYNIVKPAPAKIIETLDLKPGVKKCTERAHNGADAYFDYKVTYADGQIKQKRFSSHYVPWREVCLLGVEKLSSPPETDSATSTPPAAAN